MANPAAALDFWPTPPEITEALIQVHSPPKGEPIIEPSAGDGSICRVLKRHGHIVIGIEIQPRFQASLAQICDAVYIQDWLQFSIATTSYGVDSVIGNPPYTPASLMVAHVEHALQWAQYYVAMLLPCTFMHSYDRVRFNRTYPVNGYYPIAKRPSCSRNNKLGKRDLSWHVWDKRMGTSQRVAIL
jgi:phospholipid N-methyltransferase